MSARRLGLAFATLATLAAGCSARSLPSAGSSSGASAAATEGCFGGCLCWTTQAECAANACEWTTTVATAYLADGGAVDAGLQGECIAPQSPDAAPTGGW